MGAQTAYKYSTPIGVAGGIVDLAPYAIDTFLNENNNGVMVFGVGVVKGTKAGTEVKLPVSASAAAAFEGITVNNLTTEYGLDGKVNIRKAAAIGVMRYGRIYARVMTGITPAYGDGLYLVTTGDEAGYFSNAAATSGSNGATHTAIAVKGRFLGTVDAANGIAEVELFNQAQA